MDNIEKIMFMEKMRYIISPIGGIGTGLFISAFLKEIDVFMIGYLVMLISAILIIILSYLIKKEMLKKDEQ